MDPTPTVCLVALDQPILDFACISDTNEIWLALDVTWSLGSSPSSENDLKPIKALQFNTGIVS